MESSAGQDGGPQEGTDRGPDRDGAVADGHLDAGDDPARDAVGDSADGRRGPADARLGPGNAEHPADAFSAEPAAGDDEVLVRLARRTAITAGILGAAILLVTATGLIWPGWFARPAGLVIGFLIIIGLTVTAAILLHRSAAWTALRAPASSPGIRAVVGAPRALHANRAGLVRRRLPAQVVPIRSESGPWVSGGAVLVHGRADGGRLAAGDDVLGRWASPRGPYLLERTRDGAVFAAERSTLGAW